MTPNSTAKAAANPVILPAQCGVPGHDLECAVCGVKLYGQRVEDVCPHRRRTRSEVLAARATVYGCCDRHADNTACDCLENAREDEC